MPAGKSPLRPIFLRCASINSKISDSLTAIISSSFFLGYELPVMTPILICSASSRGTLRTASRQLDANRPREGLSEDAVLLAAGKTLCYPVRELRVVQRPITWVSDDLRVQVWRQASDERGEEIAAPIHAWQQDEGSDHHVFATRGHRPQCTPCIHRFISGVMAMSTRPAATGMAVKMRKKTDIE